MLLPALQGPKARLIRQLDTAAELADRWGFVPVGISPSHSHQSQKSMEVTP
jgi:hypothetical protein